ncbi:MAG: hypothetical protein HZB79_07115 [Deltaproteobacteria bacterium]|nr:hypothetical protein [Deltaproteobacteria bacterium]
MKKILLLAVAVIFTAMFVGHSFAVEASFDGQYRVRAFAIENAQDFNDNIKADSDSWIDQRFRLNITLKESPVTGYVQLQIGGNNGPSSSKVWGANSDTDAVNGTNLSVVARQAYLDFPIGPVQLRLGRTEERHGFMGGGMFENIADRYIVTYKASPELVVSFIHAKATEVSTGTSAGQTAANAGVSADGNDNDRNIYHLGFTYKPQGAMYDVSARAYYVRDGLNYISRTGASTAGGDWDAWWLTAQTTLKFNPVKIYLSAAYVDGESNPANGTTSYDIQAYALHGDINATFGIVTVGLVGGIGSGDDNTTDDQLETFYAPAGAGYIQTHLFWQSGTGDYSSNFMDSASIRTNLNTQNGSRETLSNVTWAGLYADIKATDALTLGIKGATFNKTESLDNTEDHIGEEIDLTLNYKIHKGLSLFAFAAWFMPDDGIICNTTNNQATACINGTVGSHNQDTVNEYYARIQWDF